MYATGRLATPGHKKLTAGGERLVMSRSCGLDHPAFATKKGQDGNDNRHRPGHQAIARP